MSKQADSLQESIERLEAGEPLETSQGHLPVEEYLSLSLASRLRQTAWPQRNHRTAQAQRRHIIALYNTNRVTRQTSSRFRFGLFKNWRLPTVIAAVAVVLLVCGLATVISYGVLWLGGETVRMTPLAEVDITQQVAETETIEPVIHPIESLEPYASLQSNQALLTESQGLVEVLAADAWQVALDDPVLTPGTHLRTGSFSSATLVFKDGSQAQIGPNSQISIDTLAVNPEANTRQIALVQMSGESSHMVTPFEGELDVYQVDTPAALGQVKGTLFHVRVLPEQTVWVVDSGEVEVTGAQTEVQVAAGQMSSVTLDEDPTDPVKFITGQGEVSAVGKSWVIGGLPYLVYPGTIFTGDPQVGDLVSYEAHLDEAGSRVADQIMLARRNPSNTFTMTGEVQDFTDTHWVVNNQMIAVSAQTEIDPGTLVGDMVRIKGLVLGGGDLQAGEIRRIAQEDKTPFAFTGVVQKISGPVWWISGIKVKLDKDAAVDEDLLVGDSVRVQGWVEKNGSWTATSVTRFVDQNSAFEFFGALESMPPDPWVVAGIPFEVRGWSTIETGLKVGDQVRVAGQIQPDGTWLAFEIQRQDETLLNVLIGRVFSIDPWVVSGLELNLDEETIVDGDIVVGMLVRVEMLLLSDGTHIVVRIEPYDDYEWALGCQNLVGTVTSIDEDQINLDGWPALPLSEDTRIDDIIRPGAVVQVMICYDEDMDMTVVDIIILRDPPLPPPEGGDTSGSGDGEESESGDDEKDGKITICHKPDSRNPKTIVISRSAWPKHRAHGDTEGPCP
jgi:hypothetical protein